MATFAFQEAFLRVCPYCNKRVSERRYVLHMTKCASDPKAPKLRICPFNPIHRLIPSEYNNHIVECPDNRQTIREMIHKAEKLANRSQEKTFEPTNEEEEKDPWVSPGENENNKQYVIPGLNEETSKNLEISEDSFISQHQLYGLKPAERKQIYTKLTEGTIARQARNEKEQLTEEEAKELGFEVDMKKLPNNQPGKIPNSSMVKLESFECSSNNQPDGYPNSSMIKTEPVDCSSDNQPDKHQNLPIESIKSVKRSSEEIDNKSSVKKLAYMTPKEEPQTDSSMEVDKIRIKTEEDYGEQF